MGASSTTRRNVASSSMDSTAARARACFLLIHAGLNSPIDAPLYAVRDIGGNVHIIAARLCYDRTYTTCVGLKNRGTGAVLLRPAETTCLPS